MGTNGFLNIRSELQLNCLNKCGWS